MRRIVWVVSFILAVVGGLFGQAASGTIAGTATDQAGAVCQRSGDAGQRTYAVHARL
jgi:hypothetical protein